MVGGRTGRVPAGGGQMVGGEGRAPAPVFFETVSLAASAGAAGGIPPPLELGTLLPLSFLLSSVALYVIMNSGIVCADLYTTNITLSSLPGPARVGSYKLGI